MLSKCANPECSAVFLYLNQGKLFRLETGLMASMEKASRDFNENNSERKLEYFWLCEECSQSMTLAYDRAAGISTRRILTEAAVAAGAS